MILFIHKTVAHFYKHVLLKLLFGMFQFIFKLSSLLAAAATA
jgi:hypothetical protein